MARAGSLTILELVLLWFVFGASTVAAIESFSTFPLAALARLLLAGGIGALLAALLWFFLLALRRSLGYALLMLVPYVNLIAASRFARRYWTSGARAPALLALLGVALQTLGAVGLLFPTVPKLL